MHIAVEVEKYMAACRLLRELLVYSLIAVFGASAIAQSLGDIAREERQKKASAERSGTAKQKTISNIDDVQPPATGQTHNANSGAHQRLQIESPADGTIVHLGETIKVRVASSTDRSWAVLTVLTQISDVVVPAEAHSVPAEFSITIPSNVDTSGPYALTAMGRTAAGELVESDAINIAVERSDMPVSLSEVNFSSLIAQAPGQTHDLLILAHFADGKMMDVRESGKLAFRSTDTKIATVDATGTVRAVASGTASIIVSYRNPNGPDVSLTIPVTIERFLVTFSPSSLDFGEVQVGKNASLSIKVTNNSKSDSQLRIKAITSTGFYSATDNCISSSPLAVDATLRNYSQLQAGCTRPEPGDAQYI
jgi:hypothetical protein